MAKLCITFNATKHVKIEHILCIFYVFMAVLLSSFITVVRNNRGIILFDKNYAQCPFQLQKYERRLMFMVKNIWGAANSGTDTLSLLENVRVDFSVFTVWHGLFEMSKERKKSNNNIHPQGVNFNTVYYELQTDKIAAWIHTKMCVVGFFFNQNSVFVRSSPHSV